MPKSIKKLIALVMTQVLLLTLSIKIDAKENTRPNFERLEPEVIVISDHDGIQYVCFTPTGGKEVARIFTDYHTIWNYMLLLESETSKLKKEVTLLNDNERRLEHLYLESEKRGNTFKDSFYSTHKLLVESEKKCGDRGRYAWVPWGVTALVSVAFAIFYVSK